VYLWTIVLFLGIRGKLPRYLVVHPFSSGVVGGVS